jgi:hypothetical protein
MRKWVDLTGELVLRCLDDRSGLTWEGLISELGLSDVPSGEMALINCLAALFDAEFICVPELGNLHHAAAALQNTWDEEGDGFKLALSLASDKRNLKIRTAPNWQKAQKILSMPFLGGHSINTNFSMVVNPLFGNPGTAAKHSDIFVLMPFRQEMTTIYADHIVRVAEALKLTVMRADDLFGSSMIMTDVWCMMSGAALIIADLTGKNPNVFYELGVAHTIGKPAVIISQRIDDVPFDLRHLRALIYAYDVPGMRAFEQKLSLAIKETLGLYT